MIGVVYDFSGSTVIITGAAQGQGEAEARAFARSGANVIVADIQVEQGEALASEISSRGDLATFVKLDVSADESWAALVQALSGQPPVRTLVNNAGILTRTGRLLNSSLDDWDRLLSVNLMGPLLGMRHIAPLMRDAGGGAIINTGSIAALNGHFMTVYSTTKWALRGLSRSAAIELAPWNIRVNCVHPGYIDTPMAGGNPDLTAAFLAHTTLGRAGTVDEVARMMLFLASDESGYLTGQDIPVDGGFTNLGLFTQLEKAFESGIKPASAPDASST